MKTIQGKPFAKGSGTGPALVTREPISFTASFSKPHNLLPWRKSEIMDRHHDLFGKRIKNTVLVFPSAIGSTYTGMMLLDIIQRGCAPAAFIVQNADSLLVSGAILASVWCDVSTPIVEYPSDDIYDIIQNGDEVSVNGESGEIQII